tara:strand:+ start:101 stop:922 length:822 start_codon:yes stop_codon:yes gene_type:complete
MELPFKPQSTPFTCVQAVQAIALNHYLSTTYSDIDVVKAQGGYLLQPSTLIGLHEKTLSDVAPLAEYNSPTHYKLSMGVLKFLGEKGSLPSLEEAIQGFAEVAPEGHGEESIKELEERMSSEDMRRFYKEFTSRIHDRLLVHLDYNVVCDHTDRKPRDNDIVTNIPKLSEGKLTVSPYEDDSFDSYTTEQGILVFGASRHNLNLLPSVGSHEWVVDREEEGSFVLLDTNHSVYEHGPEVHIQIALLNQMLANLRNGKYMNIITQPVLIHPRTN